MAAAKKDVNPTTHMLCSQTAGGISTFLYYPLDVVKMRFMSQDGTATRAHNNTMKYNSTLKAMRTIHSEEGLKTLYRGVHIAVSGATIAWGVYMWLYRHFQNQLTEYAGGNANIGPGGAFGVKGLASNMASAVSAFMTNPIWLIKARMQLEEVHHAKEMHYQTFRGGLVHVIKTTGVQSLWRGVGAQLLLGIPNAFNFPIYDTIKAYRLRTSGMEQLPLHEVCVCSTLTKTLLMFISHPIFVIKTRLHDHRSREGPVTYRNVVDATLTTAKREGLRGMYRGMVPSLQQMIPRSVTQFVLYEAILQSGAFQTPSWPAFA